MTGMKQVRHEVVYLAQYSRETGFFRLRELLPAKASGTMERFLMGAMGRTERNVKAQVWDQVLRPILQDFQRYGEG